MITSVVYFIEHLVPILGGWDEWRKEEKVEVTSGKGADSLSYSSWTW